MSYLIKNIQVVSSTGIKAQDVLISNGRFEKIAGTIENKGNAQEIDGSGKYLFPGAIDDQVHFREPGLTHKANIYTESRAAVAGGITSFMEMPNTNPQSLTQELLEDKYQIAAKASPANYSFFMGVSNENLEEVLKTDLTKVCGAKVFMGSSTGNMLVDDEHTLAKLFSNFEGLIASHCEDEATIKANMQKALDKYGEDIPFEQHPVIRDAEACYISSSKAVALAKKTGARLHILHISTAKELELFEAGPLENKKITAEACVHHLWFTDADYAKKGSRIKWNPAVKSQADRDAVRQAVLDDKIDVLATDHAPHTNEEKEGIYTKAPSGGPLVQHYMQALLDLNKQGVFSLEKIAEKTAEAPARLFKIKERCFIREGYYADCVIIDANTPYTVSKNNILYKCGWSPFDGHNFSSTIEKTFVNGNLVFENGALIEGTNGARLEFNR